MFELVNNPKDFRLNVTVSPAKVSTIGCGIIIKVEDVPTKRQGMLGDKIFTVLTDFGNIITLTRDEMGSRYQAIAVDDPQERFERQRDLLNDVEVAMYASGVFK